MDCCYLLGRRFFPPIIANAISNQISCSVPVQSRGYGIKRNEIVDYSCRAGTKQRDFSNGDDSVTNDNGSVLGGGKDQVPRSFETVNAEITGETVDFFVSDAEGDPDSPSKGYVSIKEALNAIREGKFIIVVDDENGEIEGNLVMAASAASPKSMAFIIKHGSGIISVGMKEEDLHRLNIPLMHPSKDDPYAATFTVTVDAKSGISSGVSSSDRTKTVLALSSPDSKPEDFVRPGHIFPLMYINGGVLKRAGHTEASVDLVTLAGLRPASVLSCILNEEDGSVANLSYLKKMALQYNFPIISITDLIRYRRKRERLVERIAVSRLPTKWGQFKAYCYRSMLDGNEHMAVVKGEIDQGENILVRVHSECFTGDVFGSARCDCGNQLALAMELIEKEGRGAIVYLRGHEGRGIGLGHKLRAYNLQDQGHDTVDANTKLGLAVDSREYGIGAQSQKGLHINSRDVTHPISHDQQILRDIGVRTMRLMTNNPAKFTGLKGYGLAVISRVPLISPMTKENWRYLETKRTKMGHVYGSDLPGSIAGLIHPIHPNEDDMKKKDV